MKVRKIRTNLSVAGEDGGSQENTDAETEGCVWEADCTDVSSYTGRGPRSPPASAHAMSCPCCRFPALPTDLYFTLISVGRLFLTGRVTVGGAHSEDSTPFCTAAIFCAPPEGPADAGGSNSLSVIETIRLECV